MEVQQGHLVDGIARLYPDHGLQPKYDLSAESRMATAKEQRAYKGKQIPGDDGDYQVADGKGK